MANRLKQEQEDQPETKDKKERKKRPNSSWKTRFDTLLFYLNDERTQKVFGLFLLFS